MDGYPYLVRIVEGRLSQLADLSKETPVEAPPAARNQRLPRLIAEEALMTIVLAIGQAVAEESKFYIPDFGMLRADSSQHIFLEVPGYVKDRIADRSGT